MTDREIQEFNSAVRMIEITAANVELFNRNAKAVGLIDALKTSIETLESAGASRVSASGLQTDGTSGKRVAQTALDELVRKIVANAKIIKKAEPNFENVFKITTTGLSAPQLLDTARAFANSLTDGVIAKFEEYGYAAATPANLTTQIDAFEAARAQQNTGKGGGVAATAATRAVIKNLKDNRRLLKIIGENILEANGDAGLIAEWKSACRLEKSKSATKTETPVSSAVAPVDSTITPVDPKETE